MKKYLSFWLLLWVFFLVACGGAESATAVPTNIALQPTATELPAATAVANTPTFPTSEAIATTTPDSTTTNSLPTPSRIFSLLPTPTGIPAVLLTPAAHAPDVLQPPYAASECSDRFPCNDDIAGWEARIRVPEGFAASYFSQLPNPEYPERGLQLTSMTFGPDGLLYVASTSGNIYQINNEGTAALYVDGLIVPTGLAFQPGTNKLFVSNRVLDRNVGGEGQISVVADGQVSTLFAGLPCCYIGMHGPNGIAFGPDGYGYVGVGARADHGEILDGSNRQDEMQPYEAAILRFHPDGTTVEPYAYGFRNPYDISWNADGQIFATDNGRDGNAADGDIVPEELHLVEPGGQHGYPYYDCPACYGIPDNVNVVEPLQEFEPHSVPAGITTYLAEQFPGYYNSQLLVMWTALPFASRVVRIAPDGSASTFATGFAAPLDVVVGPQGSLYVADFATGIIFKIDYLG